jgi:hypothetical protein
MNSKVTSVAKDKANGHHELADAHQNKIAKHHALPK